MFRLPSHRGCSEARTASHLVSAHSVHCAVLCQGGDSSLGRCARRMGQFIACNSSVDAVVLITLGLVCPSVCQCVSMCVSPVHVLTFKNLDLET